MKDRLDQVKSGKDYADLLTTPLMSDPELDYLIEYMVPRIERLCEDSYNDYITGKREDFRLSEEDLRKVYEESVQDFVGDTLGKMTEEGLLEVHIDEQGEFMYGLTELGKDIAKELEDKLGKTEE